jgi:hypothetical protein
LRGPRLAACDNPLRGTELREARGASFDVALSETEIQEARGASRGNGFRGSDNADSLSLRFGLQSMGFFSLGTAEAASSKPAVRRRVVWCSFDCLATCVPTRFPSITLARACGRTLVHSGNTQQRRGFWGLPIAASCGGRIHPQSAKVPPRFRTQSACAPAADSLSVAPCLWVNEKRQPGRVAAPVPCRLPPEAF